MGTTSTRRSSPARYDVADDDSLYETRIPSSARRYRPHATMDDPMLQKGTLVQRRGRRIVPGLQQQGINSKAVAPSDTEKSAPRRNPLLVLVVGGLAAVLLLVLINVVATWWQGYQDNITYGYPRTSQIDAVVGHNDSQAHPTHFIFLNLRCNIQVIEIEGGDPAHTRIFKGPTLYGSGCDAVPVTGEIRIEQGQRNLILHIQDQQIVFVNDGKTFQMR